MNIMRTRLGWLAILVGTFTASAASALTVGSASIGGDKGCDSLACTTQTHTFDSALPGTGGGSITLGSGTLSFSITVSGALFTSSSEDDVTFSNVSYAGTASVLVVGPSVSIVSSSGVTVSGDATVGAGSPQSFSTVPPGGVGGTCTIDLSGGLVCGLTFAFQDNAFDVGGQHRYFFHTVNLTALATPEPSLALLLALGLAGAGVMRRR